jgi:hypothetical protein
VETGGAELVTLLEKEGYDRFTKAAV